MEFCIADTHSDSLAMTELQQFLIYQSEDGATRIDVMLEAEADRVLRTRQKRPPK